MEELMDVYLQFQLYYADDVPKMQVWFREKEKTSKKTKKNGKSERKLDEDGNDLGEGDSENQMDGSKKGNTEDENDEFGIGSEKKKDNDENEEEKGDDEDDKEGDDDDEEEKPLRKVPRRRDFYTICKDNGLGALVKKFGLSLTQFAENLRDNYQRHEPEQVPEEPEELAEQYICKYVSYLLF